MPGSEAGVTTLSIPRVGAVANVRNRRGLVTAVAPFGEPQVHLVTIEYIDSDGAPEEQLLWEVEPNARVLEPTALPDPSREAPKPPDWFLGQALVEVGQPWPFGERSHGVEGLLEAYGEWFETQDGPAILRYLDYLTKKRVKGHWPCPCGSGAKLRHCHFRQLRTLREKIPRSIARSVPGKLRYVQNLARSSGSKMNAPIQ